MRSILLTPLLFGPSSLAQSFQNRLFPHLIIPLKESTPITPQGTKYTAEVSSGPGGADRVWTEILFDVPSNTASSCRLAMYIDKNSPHRLWGQDPVAFDVYTLNDTPNRDIDTWTQHPRSSQRVATFQIGYDNTVTLIRGGSVPCSKGETANFLLMTSDQTRENGLTWYELDNPLAGIAYEMFG